MAGWQTFRMRFNRFWTLLLVPLFSSASWGACADKSLKKWDVRNLHPTQLAVGFREVDSKREELDGSEKKIEKFLCGNPIPVVLGPGGEAYVLDHHHLGLAIILEKRRDAYVEIRHDWTEEETAVFWVQMQKNRFVYLRDELGKSRRVEDLPTRLKDLKDDPYRSLAYFVRKQGGYLKTRSLYAEFEWAEFFRTRVDVGRTDHDFKKAVSTATQLARTPAAANLPGYNPRP